MQARMFSSSAELYDKAAEEIAQAINKIAMSKDEVSITFATGNTQIPLLERLVLKPIMWEQVVGYHLDEYKGVGIDDPNSFASFLKLRLISRVPLKAFHFISLEDHFVERDIAILGLGVNAHIAFNEPGVVQPEAFVHEVELAASTRDQIREAFEGREPSHAVTLSINGILAHKSIYGLALGQSKIGAVQAMLSCQNDNNIPASFLHDHPNTYFFLDKEACDMV